MLVEKEIKKILHQLAGGDLIQVSYGGSELFIRFIDEASKLALTTSVYEGYNYIPKSVRQSLTSRLPNQQSSIHTFLNIDENQYQINLNYLGRAQPLDHDHFKELLVEFSELADRWRFFLDEHDKHDLVHIYIPKN